MGLGWIVSPFLPLYPRCACATSATSGLLTSHFSRLIYVTMSLHQWVLVLLPTDTFVCWSCWPPGWWNKSFLHFFWTIYILCLSMKLISMDCCQCQWVNFSTTLLESLLATILQTAWNFRIVPLSNGNFHGSSSLFLFWAAMSPGFNHLYG